MYYMYNGNKTEKALLFTKLTKRNIYWIHGMTDYEVKIIINVALNVKMDFFQCRTENWCKNLIIATNEQKKTSSIHIHIYLRLYIWKK